MVVLGALVLAPAASASSHHPKGEFEQFGECPLNRATITDCVFSVSSGGYFKVGNRTVPLEKPVTLQGGYEGSGEGIEFYGAENGETLSKTPQTVPGGLFGIKAPEWWSKEAQEWFNKLINEGFTGVTATVEIAGATEGLTGIKLNTGNLLFQEGTALGLPSKVKLNNKILGSNCYVGSNSSPVQIDFTTGKSGKLEGSVGEVSFNESFTMVTISGGKLVNNTFAAPGASGCGGKFSSLVDPLVDALLGIPSKSGENEAVLEGVLKDAAAEAVRASE
jgi:hypothetical protein